ncbi:hypothetical protein [Mucilaginibacter lappiensis]|uniref:Class IIb bacteriocin, lactobin A/cerein 7B family n=1 Tax=Mucilaginibacter lappiensis TaxID=354630 RepID=A0A1N7FT94_9SPHI|nr:hypothetical protein [Mucilaginibacter lappiensis]MBB6112590.1 hypothetical protein [Mucilaginibacter lappiensis]MBB6129173.1 hypothetical protein [Mucilaginibacter lappiensis]SIS03487.1 hypothetical protein SAMN05421821_119125 [Mucilaginibacter lappiensis]
MKNLELKELGVQEMNTTEMTNVNGGGPLSDLLVNTLFVVLGGVSILVNNTVQFAGYTVNSLLNFIKS